MARQVEIVLNVGRWHLVSISGEGYLLESLMSLSRPLKLLSASTMALLTALAPPLSSRPEGRLGRGGT